MYLEVYPLVILYGLSVHCHHLMTDLSPFTEGYVQGLGSWCCTATTSVTSTMASVAGETLASGRHFP